VGRHDGFDVFLSYARSDGAAAKELNSWLCAHGLRTFFDRSELRSGLRWIPALEDAIGRSDAVAILVGRHGLGNTQQYERELALVQQTRDKSFPVIPVLMPGCENPPTGFLQLLTWIDLSRDDSILRQTDGLEALRGAIRRQAVPSSSIRTKICPYRGLEPFREEDAAFFCGRDDAIRTLVSQVQTYSIVAVVGPSGSGKSSLVFAGLLPALRHQRETTVWEVVSFRPGASPLRALAAAFGTVPEDAGPAATDTYLENEVAAYRAGDPGKLGRIVNDRLDAAPEKPKRILIYVDQWEELYAMAPTTEDAEQHRQHSSDVEKFIALLVAAASGRKSRATVVLTVRADFYNPLIRHTLLSTLLPRQQVNIPPMSPSDLRSAIETPAMKAGLSFLPPALVDQILNDVGTEQGRLPLLQFALKETWERREGDRLTAEAYTEVGGVAGAIQKTAERAYAALTPVQQEAARRLFLRLITPGEGQEDTRARGAFPDDPQQRDIINLFSNPRTRILVTGYETLQGPTQLAGRDLRVTVEIAHEALIRRWPMLRAWVDANREKLRARAAILRAKAEWEEKGNIDTFLLDPGIQLERGRSLLESPGDVPVDDIRDYVNCSIKREQRRLDAEREAALADQERIAAAERQAKEAAEEVARQAEAARSAAEGARRKLRNRLVIAASAAVIALLAFAASVYEGNVALQRAWESQRQLDRANRALATGILADLDLKPHQSLTGRHRNALWNLATADEAVRAEFISALSANPEDMARAAGGFREVSRSLGLQWPSPADADKLLATAVAALGKSDNATTGLVIIDALQALAAKLTGAQAQQALATLLQQIDKTTNSNVLGALTEGLKALAAKLTEAPAEQALAPLLQRIGETTDPGELYLLAEGLQALAPKLTQAQAEQALAPLLLQIGRTRDPFALPALAKGLQALPAKLTEAQVQQAFAPLQQEIGETTDPVVFWALAKGLQVLPAKLTEAQAERALARLLQQIGETTDPVVVYALAEGLQALPVRLTEAQGEQVLAPLLQQIVKATDTGELQTLVGGLQWLAPNLTEAQAEQALAPLLLQIGRTSDPFALPALAEGLKALAAKLTETQAERTLVPLLQQIGKTTNANALRALAVGLKALATKLTEAQAEQVLARLLQEIERTPNPFAFPAWAVGLKALAPNLTEAQAQEALARLLQRITTDHYALYALAEGLQALPVMLTEAQAELVLAPLLQRIGKTTDSDELQALAGGLQALAPKLTQAQARQSLSVTMSSLAWAATEEEAADWARALVALLPRATDQSDGPRDLVAAIIYPLAAGPSTGILLDALRARDADAPTKEVGTAASLAWIAEKYRHQVHRPICPEPPQPSSLSGLKCPLGD
jgi:hypothetical protein